MEIDFNKEEENTDQFVNFSIREYVAGIRKKDRKKCWPFGSLGDPDKHDLFASYHFQERTSFSSQICPGDYTSEHTDMIESIEIDDNKDKTICDGKVNNAQCQQENSINEGAKIWRSIVAADKDEEPGRNQPRKEPQKFLLLSNILRDLAGPSGEFHVRCNVANLDNVNSRFATETEDESDDVTLNTFFRKQTGFEVTPLKKKKRKMIRVLDQDKRSKLGSKDSNENDSDFGPRKRKDNPKLAEVGATETANENSEMEAVMLLASHFNEENPSRPTNGTKTTQMVQSGSRTKESDQMELLEATKRISTSSSGGNQPAESAKHNISNPAAGMACACVQKKTRKSSTPAGTEPIRTFYTKTLSKTVTKDSVLYGDKSKKLAKEKRMILVCSINRNPADISVVNAENKYMRGG